MYNKHFQKNKHGYKNCFVFQNLNKIKCFSLGKQNSQFIMLSFFNLKMLNAACLFSNGRTVLSFSR